jgi:hypothetical protein
MSRKRKDIVFVNFYTANYKARADRLRESLDKFGLKHAIVEIEEEGSFEEIVSKKPEFIGMMMDEHPKAKAIVWLDADAVVVKDPKLFYELKGIDMACHWREGVELLSGTMYWSTSNKAKQQLGMWCAAMEHGEGFGLACPEQMVLARHIFDWNIRAYSLPTEYCFIEDLPEANDAARKIDPVIIQYAASRTERYRGEDGNPAPVARVDATKPEDLSIAVLLPTRARPESVVRLLRSIEKTVAVAPKVSMHLRLDGDDKVMLKAMRDIQRGSAITVEASVGPRVALGATWNNLWRNVDADIYMLCADDMIFESERWDEKVREHFWEDRLKLVFGSDNMQDGKLATHFFLSHEGCELLGYFCPPEFEAIYLDTWVDEVYREAGKLVYDETIKIPHLHWTKTNKIDEVITRDRGGRKARDQKRWDEGADKRMADARKLGATP